MFAELTGIEVLGISEDEVANLAAGLARVIVARGGLARAERASREYGPWTNFSLILATVYVPRLVCLWKLWQEERKKGVLAVMPVRTREVDPENVPAAEVVH